MSVSIKLGTPLAEALNEAVQPKLVDVGWSTGGGDDSALAEYVILMLVNGKTQDQIATELANDLLSLGPEDTEAADFAKWLFEKVHELNNKINGVSAETEQQKQSQVIPSISEQQSSSSLPAGTGDFRDSEMSGDVTNEGQDGNIMTQFYTVYAATKVQNESTAIPEIPRKVREHFRGETDVCFQGGYPDQWMMAMLEEQARMMAQIIPGMVPPAINPAFQNGPPPGQQGRSLFDRAEINPHRNQHLGPQEHTNGHSSKFHTPSANADVDMNTSHNAPDSSMDVDAAHETQSAEPGPHTVCRFNLKCTRKDCPYAHQSPAAPEGMVVDVNDECPFGAACKNRKCAARHPSPAQKIEHQSEELCRFFPHCTNPNCTFKHPSMPMCRNGADCTVPSCKYTHLQIPCKFKPCLNRMCPFKHAEGQRGVFADKVWRAGDEEKKEHVSERRFVTDEDGQEELIKPETTVADPSADADEAKGHEIVT
ncbi:conserved hypothetical protein [Histoplasma mississippiense (nom. inval.)]|uniref:conserved hypothetical protein n=1 Tax=Ajellomyces capsulatus (strain NAm1 / WU24) TaxID=2059318 RepID=UPI000157CD0D|nr:conserved hypothetical protein [Histoplasma mississippiense (nom. inval.)]EDN10121.1 conserved hypothetical protein [Histoplasma mississippiense (nom. inval.)]